MSLPLDFDGGVAVITGVGRAGQVGEAVARRFALLGATVILLDRSAEVHERGRELQLSATRLLALECDLTDPASAALAVDRIRSFGVSAVRALICLAGGFAMSGPVAESDPDVWHRQMAINLTTAYVTTRAFLPLVRVGMGSIVYFGSASALPGAVVGRMSAYCVAKAGVLTLMRAVAQEERANGVRANALAPTSIRTHSNLESMGPDAAYVEREDVADWVVSLCTPSAASVNGQVIKLG